MLFSGLWVHHHHYFHLSWMAYLNTIMTLKEEDKTPVAINRHFLSSRSSILASSFGLIYSFKETLHSC